MATKKGGGSSRNGRESHSKRRGTKAFAGQWVHGGSVLVRQCGNKLWAGDNVGQGRDFTLFAKVNGLVNMQERRGRRYVHVIPES